MEKMTLSSLVPMAHVRSVKSDSSLLEMIRRIAPWVCSALALFVCRAPAPEPLPGAPPEATEGRASVDLAEFSGTWVARLSHAGTTESFALDLVPNENGTVIRAYISIPAIDLWSYSIGAASISGDTVRAGPLELRYDAGGPRLLGTVPKGLVPHQTIALDLRRGDAPDRPAPAPELPSPDVQWTYSTGGPIWAGVTVGDGKVFVGSDDGVVYALDLQGNELWRLMTTAPVRAEPTFHRDTGTVLVHSDDGFLYRVSASDGEIVWKTELAQAPTRRPAYGAAGFRYEQYGSAPAISGGRVYVGHGSGVDALALETGAILWSKTLEDHTTSSPLPANGRIFLGSFDGHVYALDAASGEVVWAHDTGAPVPSSVAVHYGDNRDRIIAGSRSYELLALDASDGSEVWSHYFWFSWVESSPVVAEGVVLVGSSDLQKLHAIDASSGALSWTFDTNGSAWARPAVSEEAVYIGAVGVAGYIVDHQGGFFAVDRETGRGLWRFSSPKPDGKPLWGFAASAAADEDLVVAGGLDGNVYAFR